MNIVTIMHRLVATRVFAALLAVWFTINMVEPRWLHACPVHDGLLVPAAGESHSAETGHAGHQGPSHDESDAPAKAHLCQCLGACSAAAIVSAPLSTPIVTAERRIADPVLPEYRHPVFERTHELPFANGPPLA